MTENSNDAAPPPPAKPPRLPSIDVLRGLVMALMALDHVRDYFSIVRSRITDPSSTTAALFFTRWVSHFCAPAFFLLAGIGVHLSVSRGTQSLGTHSRRLLTRGFVLILIDVLVVRIGWDFNFEFDDGPWFIVLSALGVSMMILAGLIHLPRPVILIFSLVVICGHNLLDWVDNEDLGKWEPVWVFLHLQQGSAVAGRPFYVNYPLIPWFGVMSLGYGIGPIFQLDSKSRRRWLFAIGLLITLAFVTLRTINVYGDPYPRSHEYEGFDKVLDFLATEKYPASFLYLLMTLGPILMLLAALDRAKGKWADWLTTLGRVPLFFYVLHIYVIHALAVIAGVYKGFAFWDMCDVYVNFPPQYGFRLLVVYAVTVFVLAICYPACVWFDNLKRTHKSAWLSYL